MSQTRDLSVHELHALPADVLLNATLAARLLNLPQSTFERIVRSGVLEEARFEPSPRVIRWWKGKLLEAAVSGGRNVRHGASE